MPKAILQAKDISNYISNVLMSPSAARNWPNHLKESIERLNEMPNRYPIIDDEPWKSRKIHRMNVGSYCVYYLVDNDVETVYILSIVYAKREQINVFREIGTAK